MGTSQLNGLRVLVVEDESMVAMLLEDFLTDHGCQVVATAGRIDEALSLIGAPDFAVDLAVLDVNLAGKRIDPVADALAALGAPMIFSTGYGEAGLPANMHGRPVMQKPYASADVTRALREALGATTTG